MKRSDQEIRQIRKARAEIMRRKVSQECQSCTQYNKNCKGIVIYHADFCPDVRKGGAS